MSFARNHTDVRRSGSPPMAASNRDTSDHLKIHMKTQDNQQLFQCTICNRGYNTAAALTSHMQNHKQQLPLTRCPNLTYRPRSTTSSLSSGGGSGGSLQDMFSCYKCLVALPDFESLWTHLRTVDCEESDAAAKGPSGADASVVGNGGSGTSASHGTLSLSAFLCQQCGATLSCQAEYEQHTIGHYLVTAIEYRCQAAGSSSTCATGKATTFGKVEDLHKHLYEGHMQLLYKCTMCGETFETKVQVQVHFAVNHSVQEKLYRCSACAEVCRTERDFRQHIRNRHPAAAAQRLHFPSHLQAHEDPALDEYAV